MEKSFFYTDRHFVGTLVALFIVVGVISSPVISLLAETISTVGTTVTLPTVTTPTATSITSTSATLGADITSNGGAAITGRGTCWGTHTDTITNCAPTESISTGVFTHSRTGMPSGTLIYYRGYATNSVGKAYSASGSFLTTVTTAVTTATASFSVVPTLLVDCNDPLVPKTKTKFTVNPATGGSFSVLLEGIGTMNTTNFMPGEHLLHNGLYNWSAVVSSGYSGSGPLNGSFSINVTCPSSTTSTTIPTVTTPTATSITSTSATLGADITSNGGADITSRGTCWGTHTDTITNCAPTESISTGVFTHSRTGMPSGTLIYYKGYATNSVGKAYSASGSFTTTVTTAVTTATASFSVVPSSTIVCTEPLYPKTKVLFTTSPTAGGFFYLSPNSWTRNKVELGSLLLGNGSYTWSASVNNGYLGVAPLQGNFNLSATCVVPSSVPITDTVTTQILNEIKTTIHSEVTTPISQAEKIDILERVNSPAVCMSRAECAVYCSQTGATGVGLCDNFTRTSFVPTTLKAVVPSFIDGVSLDSVQAILNDATRRPAEIPEAVQSSSDFRSFCSSLDNKETCLTLLNKNNLSSQSVINANSARVEQVHQQERKVFTERVGARVFIDNDNDGVSDYDEINIYRTNPKVEDTDKDGISDGNEIILRTSPISREKAERFANVSQNNPLVSGILEPKLLVVKEVNASSVATSAEGVLVAKSITFRGIAIPNSFVTLYIYSEPTVVTLKTNASGEWIYTLEKELPDGEHQVITAITDGGGRVLAKSEPFRFVKVAQAITVGNIELVVPVTSQDAGFFAGTSLYTLIAIMIGIIGAGVLLVGFIAKNRSEDEGSMVG